MSTAKEKGYGEYLFLLELSHLIGPALRIPDATRRDARVGFTFHWSFWLDAASPAGGNSWRDNGDGTFTTEAATPSGDQ